MSIFSPRFLCMDTALGTGSVCIFEGQTLVSFAESTGRGMQATQLLPMVEQCLSEADMHAAALNSILCTIGPGSFTGIRIALSAARALGFTLGLPVIGVSTLACIAAEYYAAKPASGEITAILPAGRGNLYAQRFASWGAADITPVGDAQLQPCSTLTTADKAVALASSTFSGLDSDITTTERMDARSIGRLHALSGFSQQHAQAPNPLYIRPPDAALPKKKA